VSPRYGLRPAFTNLSMVGVLLCRHMKALLALFAVLVPSRMMAQDPAEWQDGLVNHLAGSWKLEGKVMGGNAHHDVQVDWVF
jgi:hypothetical protein